MHKTTLYPGRLYYLVICNYIRPILGTGTDMLVIKKTCRPGGRLQSENARMCVGGMNMYPL